MLFEQFLDRCEELFETSLTGKKEVSLLPEFRQLVSLVDKEELSSYVSLEDYFSKFTSYFSKIDNLSNDRKFRRLRNGLEMIEKLRRIFLLRSTEEIESLLGRPVSHSTPIKFAYSVGEARSKILKRMDIETIGDLIHYFPETTKIAG